MLRAIRFQIQKDKSAERVAFLNQYFQHSMWRRWVLLTLDHPKFFLLKVLGCVTYGLFRLPNLSTKSKGLAIWWSKNEKVHLAKMISAENADFRPIAFELRAVCRWLQFDDWGRILQNIRILWRLCKKESFPIAARATETIFLYQFFESWRKRCGTTPVYYLSTQSQPHFSALNELSRNCRVKLCFVSHSPWVLGPLPIFCDTGIFWGKSGSDQFLKVGSKINNLIYFYPERTIRKASTDNKQHILIALSKNPNFSRLAQLLDELRFRFPDTPLRIRCHPNSPFEVPLDISSNKSIFSLAEDLTSAKFMIAGNSTVHLEAFLFDVPSFWDPNLDIEVETPLEIFCDVKILKWNEFSHYDLGKLECVYSTDLFEKVKSSYFSQNTFEELNRRIQSIYHQ